MIGNSFSYSSQLPAYSITSDASQDSLDSQQPYSFYDFLKYVQTDLSPLQANDAYQHYLKEWGASKKLIASEADALIKERYIELLKDITLNYLTFEEKRFISNADFSDPQDLDIVIPFFSKKIREICQFYAQKRETLKHKVLALRDKGNRNSVQQSIFESITDFLFVSDSTDLVNNVPSLKLTNIVASLKIEIEELFDLYASYLDNSPTQTAESYDVRTQLRKDLYSANINSIESDIFINFDNAVKQYIFDNLKVFIKELGNSFAIDYNLDEVNLNCKQNDNLFDLINGVKDEAIDVINLRKKLIQKFIGADIYYIKTGSTASDIVSGLLVKADNPSGNLLNRHYPTTASVEEDGFLYPIRRIGNFFRPEKNGILYFSAPESRYKINFDKLESNKVYMYPDPSLYGNTTGLTNEVISDYPLIHIQDYQHNIQNASYFAAEGDIKTDPYTQNFYAYYSKNQLSNLIDTNYGGLSANLASVVDQGVITKWACDIFGNQYGLLKQTNRKTIIDNSTPVATQSLTAYEYYDGGIAAFDNEGAVPEPIRADYPQWPFVNLYSSNYFYNALFDGGIGQILNGIMYRPLLANRIYDGLLFTAPPETVYDITLNLSNITFSDGTETIDGGLFTDIPVFEADLTLVYVLSSIQYKEMDGGPLIRAEDYSKPNNTFLINEINTDKDTVVSSVDDILESDLGSLVVKDAVLGTVTPISAALLNVLGIYNTDIQNQITNSVIDFNVYKDITYITTPDYFVVSKIEYDGTFTSKGTDYLTISSSDIAISQPFFFESRDYALLCTIELLSSSSNACAIFPTLYKLQYKDAKLDKLTTLNAPLSGFINSLPIKLVNITNVVLTYNSRNDVYTIIASLEDQNGLSYLFQMFFTFDEEFITNRGIRLVSFCDNSEIQTINWYDQEDQSSNMTFNNQTATIAVNNGALCIYG